MGGHMPVMPGTPRMRPLARSMVAAHWARDDAARQTRREGGLFLCVFCDLFSFPGGRGAGSECFLTAGGGGPTSSVYQRERLRRAGVGQKIICTVKRDNKIANSVS